MMGSYSDYFENKILDLLTGNATYTLPTATKIWIGLSTADPLDDGSGLAEPSGSGYARIETVGATNWNVAAGGVSSNKTDLTFPTCTGTWGNITHFEIFDAITGGNMLAHGSLGASYPTANGTILKFIIGSLTITQS